MNNHTVRIDKLDEFREFFTPANQEKPEIHGGFALSHWCGKTDCENKINEELSVTIRCIPFDMDKETGSCIYCGALSNGRVVFAKAY